MYIQIKGPDLLFSADTLSFSKIKNCDINNLKMCTKISQTLNLKFTIVTTLTKYAYDKVGRKRGKYVK